MHRKVATRRWPGQQAHLAASHQIREVQSPAVGARASPTASVDSIPNHSQTRSANGPRSHGELLQCHATQTHRRCAPSEWAASCRPPCNPAHPAYSRVALAEASARACLPNKRRGGEENKIPAPAGSAVSTWAQPQLRPLRCRRPSAALPDGSEGLGLLARAGAGARGGLEIDCGYQSRCRVGRSYIRLAFHVMTMMVVTGEADGRC